MLRRWPETRQDSHGEREKKGWFSHQGRYAAARCRPCRGREDGVLDRGSGEKLGRAACRIPHVDPLQFTATGLWCCLGGRDDAARRSRSYVPERVVAVCVCLTVRFFCKKLIIASGPLGPPVIFPDNIIQIKLKNFLGPKILKMAICVLSCIKK